jgi:hypothetical protein
MARLLNSAINHVVLATPTDHPVKYTHLQHIVKRSADPEYINNPIQFSALNLRLRQFRFFTIKNLFRFKTTKKKSSRQHPQTTPALEQKQKEASHHGA